MKRLCGQRYDGQEIIVVKYRAAEDVPWSEYYTCDPRDAARQSLKRRTAGYETAIEKRPRAATS